VGGPHINPPVHSSSARYARISPAIEATTLIFLIHVILNTLREELLIVYVLQVSILAIDNGELVALSLDGTCPGRGIAQLLSCLGQEVFWLDIAMYPTLLMHIFDPPQLESMSDTRYTGSVGHTHQVLSRP
jgi:hypothetical protein